MEKKVKISVIIPVFNVERYIRQCVESVLKQTYEQIEIILVDDGSLDGSSEICDYFAKVSDRIKVIHKKNGGAADARNAGLSIATGDYITFLDGDDFWDDEKAIFRLVERLTITEADVLNYSYVKYYEDTSRKKPYFQNISSMPVEMVNGIYGFDYITKNGLYIASACNKMIKQSMFSEDLYFKKGNYSEDIEWCARLMIHAKTMDFVCENFYCYRQRCDSVTHTIDKVKCDDLCNNIMDCFCLCKNVNDDLKKYLCRYIAYQYGTFFIVQAQTDDDVIENIDILKPYTWILNYHGGNMKLILLRLACRVIGYKNTCRAVRYVQKKFRIWGE